MKWTEEMKSMMAECAANGMTNLETTDRLNEAFGRDLKVKGVQARANFYGLKFRYRPSSRALMWSPERVAELRRRFADKQTVAEISDAIGIRRSEIYKRLTTLGLSRPRQQRIPKTKSPKAPRPPRTAAPSIAMDDPPFAVPRKLRVEYVPSGRTPVRFMDTGEFVCRVFLPGEPIGPYGLVCGNPTSPASTYRFCAACSEAMFSHTPAPPREGDKTTFMFPKHRSAVA